jgi:hypothetical protein
MIVIQMMKNFLDNQMGKRKKKDKNNKYLMSRMFPSTQKKNTGIKLII